MWVVWGLVDRGLKGGVRPVVSDDHEGIKSAVAGELPGVRWRRCVVHFERNVLSHVPSPSMAEAAEDMKAVFKVRREKTARALAEEFSELYGKRVPKAVSVFEAGIEDALTYPSFPGSHHAKLRTTNTLERLFKEVKRRTRVVGVFLNETSASTLATKIALRSSENFGRSGATSRWTPSKRQRNRTHNFRDIDFTHSRGHYRVLHGIAFPVVSQHIAARMSRWDHWWMNGYSEDLRRKTGSPP